MCGQAKHLMTADVRQILLDVRNETC
jgi:hypothetical protein